MHEAVTGRVRTALLVLLAAVAAVMLIACANVANLLLARAVARRRELSLRAALGADRARIFRQLLTEGLLLGLGGAAGGVLFAMAAIRSLVSMAPVTLPRLEHASVDGRVLLFTAVATVVTSAVFGILPAWSAGADEARRSLATGARGTAGGSRARALLVVADLALALVLLASAGLMIRTVASLTRVNPGFDADRILSMQFALTGSQFRDDQSLVTFQHQALERLRALPGVAGASLAGQIPFARAGGGVGDCWRFHAAGRMQANPADDPCVERYGISSGYFEVMGIPLLAGRVITGEDTAASQRVVVISASAAAIVWGAADPIGAQVRLGSSRAPSTVIGVVADVRADDVAMPIVPAMYTPESQITGAYLTAIVKSSRGDPASLAGAARRALHDLDPTVPVYGVATLSSLVEQSSAQRTFVARLLAAFAGAAVLLAAIGLYGVVSYGVSQRTRELGVRLALGAQPRDVLRVVLGSGLTLIALGVGLGLAAAFAATRLLGTLVYGVSHVDPISFAGATLLLIAVALLAHWVPARRALRIDPATTLRAE